MSEVNYWCDVDVLKHTAPLFIGGQLPLTSHLAHVMETLGTVT